ncbi:hypothetical protein CcaverHIS002_0300030 [Cutaneotrichosporon cavernicola]|uniref:Peptidase A1 domain-containing protein n=1 Tax=Cutaneotrichosporon cavernicola TaxID=279322 RepID=A0AA48L222_9TREE|nr:uncharacterized protein CcaverHIS019_0300020 [Cutaneotrichosporon cavernicola]BEI82135.1 hypothetical protein CcaverHIS002_0300030 [Cutaneotrichosporon cavernicola]BEI89932.1 hypothetical protein CcaverHIS019_0300020 [Cutaneotrichosporon cavernicola]BEI97705.1 hypothetical protein CcaverHIS631_0300040 [Cutaneotrichosporon cavernicola]BEJ05482.1 hypothetical protein CcaverHIS641_0300040 [Cutaneotrichosporon cavernicola]
MISFLPLLLAAYAGAVAAPASLLETRASVSVSKNLTMVTIPIRFANQTASILINAGTPPQGISVELSLKAGQLQLGGFKPQDSGSFQDSPPRDKVEIGNVILDNWEFGFGANDAGLGGTLPLGITTPSSGNISTDLPWALASTIPEKTLSLSIGLNDSALIFGSQPNLSSWWNPTEDSMGAWTLIINGVAVNGEMVVIDEEPAPVVQTLGMNDSASASSSTSGSPPGEVPPASPTDQPAKRQATPAADPATPTPLSISPDTPTSSSNPIPSTGPDGQPCNVACTLEFQMCMCAEGEMCVRHQASCGTCPFLECVRNGTSSGTENCIACPAIYRLCDCGPNEDCVRTLATCKSCETVECRKRGSVTPANPQWEEPAVPTLTTTEPGTQPSSPSGSGTSPSGTVPAGPKPSNCTNPVMCPAIYQLCSCHADETCVRQTRCDRCEWLECHKQVKPFNDNGQCVQCEDVEPECNCPPGATCVRGPRSCTDCGSITCRNNTEPSMRFALSLDDEIAMSPQVANGLQKLIPGMVAVSAGPDKRAPTVSTTATAVSASSSNTTNNTSVSATPPPRPGGKTYYSVPCDTTADITLVFPGENYTLAAKDWVIPVANGCQAVLVMQDTFSYDMVLGRPFLRTFRAAFRLNDTAQVAFSPHNGSTLGLGSVQGTSGAGALGASVTGVLVVLATVCML